MSVVHHAHCTIFCWIFMTQNLSMGIDMVESKSPNTIIGDAQKLSKYFSNNSLQECNKVLKPNGRLILTTPNSSSWTLRVCSHGHYPVHISLTTEEQLSDKVTSAGFEIEECYLTHYSHEATPGTKWYFKPLFPVRAILDRILPRKLKEQIIMGCIKK